VESHTSNNSKGDESLRGTRLGGDGIVVEDDCNATRGIDAHIDTRFSDLVYANGISFEDFFTDAERLTVKEIEVRDHNLNTFSSRWQSEECICGDAFARKCSAHSGGD
jgi:hypothetical protein